MKRASTVVALVAVFTLGLGGALAVSDPATSTACATTTAPGTTVSGPALNAAVPDTVLSVCATATAPPASTVTGPTTTVTSIVTSTVTSSTSTTVPSTTTVPPPARVAYDTTAPGGTAGFPRSDTSCASTILLNTWEATSHGNLQYNVPRDDVATNYTDSRFSWWSSFPKWLTRRGQVTGHFTNTDGSVPTTTEIFSWAACKWGVREDLLRAVAVQESDWHENFWGDRCSGTDPNTGVGSYGIMQIKNFNCSNAGDWGGFRRTFVSTTYNVDFYGAAFRACLEGSFWYTIPAADSAATRERGCVGAWFSGSYQPASSYTNLVYGHLAAKDWLAYG